MDIEKALNVLGRQRPCEHLNYDTRLGDGHTWAKCEDCRQTFARESLPRRRAAVEEFDAALALVEKLIKAKGVR